LHWYFSYTTLTNVFGLNFTFSTLLVLSICEHLDHCENILILFLYTNLWHLRLNKDKYSLYTWLYIYTFQTDRYILCWLSTTRASSNVSMDKGLQTLWLSDHNFVKMTNLIDKVIQEWHTLFTWKHDNY
jgi:hypothetical protein